MGRRWPTPEEIVELQRKEYERAYKYDYEPDIICECGREGAACICSELVEELGYWADGTPYNDDRDYEIGQKLLEDEDYLFESPEDYI